MPDQGKASDVAACQIEADRFYQGYNGVDVNNPRSQYIIECMAAKGYDFEVSPADCDGRRALSYSASVLCSSELDGVDCRSIARSLNKRSRTNKVQPKNNLADEVCASFVVRLRPRLRFAVRSYIADAICDAAALSDRGQQLAFAQIKSNARSQRFSVQPGSRQQSKRS